MPNSHQPTCSLWGSLLTSLFIRPLSNQTVVDHGKRDDTKVPGLQEFRIQWGNRFSIFTQIIISYCCDR